MGKISFADLRAKCAELGITPGRSAEATQARIQKHYDDAAMWVEDAAQSAEPQLRMSRTMRKLADSPLTPIARILGR